MFNFFQHLIQSLGGQQRPQQKRPQQTNLEQVFAPYTGENRPNPAYPGPRRPNPQPPRQPLQVRPTQPVQNKWGLQGSRGTALQPTRRYPQAQGYSPSVMQASWNMPNNDLEISRPLQGGYADSYNVNQLPGRQRAVQLDQIFRQLFGGR